MKEVPISTPTPILQQQKSKITTNPLIQPVVEHPEVDSNEQGLITISFHNMNQKIVQCLHDINTELYNRPNKTVWHTYLISVFTKEDRLISLIVMVLYLYIIYLVFTILK